MNRRDAIKTILLAVAVTTVPQLASAFRGHSRHSRSGQRHGKTHGRTFYVDSKKGRFWHSGLEHNRPLRTVNHAIRKSRRGDTIFVILEHKRGHISRGKTAREAFGTTIKWGHR